MLNGTGGKPAGPRITGWLSAQLSAPPALPLSPFLRAPLNLNSSDTHPVAFFLALLTL